MIQTHERVVLVKPLPDLELEPGDVGIALQVLGDGASYEVAFQTLAGHTAVVAHVGAEALRTVKATDLMHCRMVEEPPAGNGTNEPVAAHQPFGFLDRITELVAGIPDEELAKLPRDGSLNYRKYLYGGG